MTFDMQKARSEKRVTEIYDHLYPAALEEIKRLTEQLAALDEIRPGDADELDYAIQELERIIELSEIAETIEVLHRYQAMASKMEESK